jgi:endonuclease III
VRTKTPEQTMLALEKILPEAYWVEINERLVPFGKHICTGVRPRCSTCPVLNMCRQVGVTDHR